MVPAAIGVAGTTASIGMGMYQANQQAAYADAADANNFEAGQSQLRYNYYNSLLDQSIYGDTSQLQIQQATEANEYYITSEMDRMSLEHQMQAQQNAMNQYLIGQEYAFQQSLSDQQLMTSILLQQQRNQLDQQMLEQQLRLQEQQGMQALALQVQIANAEIANQYSAARQAVENERMTLLTKFEADRLVYQKNLEYANAQVQENNTAVNRLYVSEQEKIAEVRNKIAFDSQAMAQDAILKAGAVMSAGRQGNSVGALMDDIRRQRGFAEAQQAASLESAIQGTNSAMESGFIASRSANNQVASNVGWAPTMPTLPEMPKQPVFIDAIGLGIATPGV